jgi:hypothetical protein
LSEHLVLSFDPGETTGWAYQDERDDYPGGLLDIGQISGLEPLVQFLEKWDKPVTQVVIEDYTVWRGNRGAKANVGSKLPTVRAIGIIESWCFRKKIPFHKYGSDLTGLQAMQCGLDTSKGQHKNTHWAYAANHGRYWLQQKGYAKTAIQRASMSSKNSGSIT